MTETTPIIDKMNKKDIVALLSLFIAIVAMFWALLPLLIDTSPAESQKSEEVGDVVVSVAKSLVNAAKGIKETPPPPKEKTFIDKLINASFIGSLFITAITFVVAIIMYVFGAKKRMFNATIAVNIVTVGIHIFWIAVAMAIIFAAIRFLDTVGINFFD